MSVDRNRDAARTSGASIFFTVPQMRTMRNVILAQLAEDGLDRFERRALKNAEDRLRWALLVEEDRQRTEERRARWEAKP